MPDPRHTPSPIHNQHRAPLVVLVGAGGLAHAVLLALYDLSPPTIEIRIIDPDRVELSNLNRQVLFGVDDIGKNKAIALRSQIQGWLKMFHPERCSDTFSSIPERLDSTNALALIQDATVVVDATDSVEIKFLLNDLCVRNQIPLCYAGVSGNDGLVLMIHPGRSACLRCLFGEFSLEEEATQSATCQQTGVLGAFVGAVGSVQAEVLRPFLDTPVPSGASSNLIRLTQEPLEIRVIAAAPNRDCPVGCEMMEQLDLTTEQCPLTFLYTKLALERLPARATLNVTLSSLASAENVKRSVAEEGYIVNAREVAGSWQVSIRRRSG